MNEIELNDVKLSLGGRVFESRLFLGTGKFSSKEALAASIRASRTDMVTVALRRVDFNRPEDDLIDVIRAENRLILPNTSGARDAEEAIRLAKMARSVLGHGFVKLELTPEPNYLLPDPVETLKAAKELIKENFYVMPYIQADPILAKRLEEVGCVTVMPLGSPIGSNRGLRAKDFIAMIIEQCEVPVVVDAGLGAPSHAAEAMEMGADAVLVNTAISIAQDPPLMAEAFKEAVISGRKAYLAGLASSAFEANASSPLSGFLNEHGQ